MAKLDGKVAVVTGGSSGIGLAMAKRFAAEGAYVFIVGRRQDALDSAVKQIGMNVKGVRADVSNLDDLDRLYKEVASTKGKLDVGRQCRNRGNQTDTRGYARALRQDIQYERPRRVVHRSEGFAGPE